MAWSVSSSTGRPTRAVAIVTRKRVRELLEHRRREPGLAAGGGHALDAAAPLLDQAERVEDAADHPVAQLRDAARKVLDREAEGQQSRVLDLEAVVEDREAQRRAALGVVGMRHRVDERLAHRRGRQAPALLAAHGADLGAVQGVLLDEGDRLLDGAHGQGADLGAIDDAALVGAVEAAGLDPGVREVPLAVLAEEDHAAHGRNLAALMVREESQRFQVPARERPEGSKRLGSGSEVEGFRVEPGHGLLVEAFAAREASELLDQLGVGATVGRAHPDVHAAGGSLPREMVRSGRARMHLHREHLRPPPGEDLDLRARCAG